MKKEKYVVTSALPYANGSIHLGHIAGAYLPADIYVRYLRQSGHDVIYIGGTDEHGVPITITAEKEGVTPQDIVDKYHKDIKEDFDKLRISFDNFSGTSRKVHHKISSEFFLRLHENGFLETQTTKQLYDEKAARFLPDRYVEGTCPGCGFPNARGDECPKCGKWIEPTELIDPVSKISGTKPVIKETTHFYLCLDKMQPLLTEYINEKTYWKDNVKNFAFAWFKEGLGKRPITRDLSWGIPVPLDGWENKVLYVWFDAPIGYLSSTVEWAERIGEPDKWKEYWQDPECKMIHFIGKDNIPFHIIVWPAILMGQYLDPDGKKSKKANEFFILPYNVPANEHLNIEGNKLSSSTGFAVFVKEYFKDFSADYLRYYLAANAPETKDSDFSWKSFQTITNADLANTLGNLANRCLTFINKNFDGKYPAPGEYENYDKEVLEKACQVPEKIGKLLYTYEVRRAAYELIDLARLGNKYFDTKTPWKDVKDNKDRAGTTLNLCMRIIKMLAALMLPFMPDSASTLWKMIGETGSVDTIMWDDISKLDIEVGMSPVDVKPLFVRIEDKVIDKVVKEFYDKVNKLKKEGQDGKSMDEQGFVEFTQKETIEFTDFEKVDLRIGLIKSAEKVEKSKKLVRMMVQVGKDERQIVAGIAPHFEDVSELVGKKVVVVANLKPAKLMGIESQGMVLAAVDDDNMLTIVTPDKDIKPGSQVR